MDCKPFKFSHGQEIRNRQVSVLRRFLSQAPSLEEVLQPKVSMECLGREASTHLQEFNMKIERRDELQLRHFRFGHKHICVYCGDPADTMDHVIPLSFTISRKRTNRMEIGPMCPACRDCNTHLSNRYFDSFWDRCRWNRDRLEHKAKPVLWTFSEAQALDYTVRSFVLHQCFMRLWYRMRADWFESPDFLMGVEDLLWQDITDEWIREYFYSTIREIKEMLSRTSRQ